MISSREEAHLREERVSSAEVFQGSFLQVVRDSVGLPDGRTATREYVVHPGAVMVIPLLEHPEAPMRVVLERQYRYPVQRVMVEFPAGKLDPGESTLECAQRELLEETGYRAGQWAKVGVIHPVIAYSTEFIEVWFARDLVAGPRQLDSGEFLDVFDAPVEDLIRACLEGQVTDAKTVSAALWLQHYVAGTWSPVWHSVA
ncbi:ADP-ribose pyrophosphatase [Comamonadaceae bacterium OS-4]|nr:ADP-ribose pyrophosphatase [Comamonadaceae bacterium OS-4]